MMIRCNIVVLRFMFEVKMLLVLEQQGKQFSPRVCLKKEKHQFSEKHKFYFTAVLVREHLTLLHNKCRLALLLLL